jgi:hypothetical protein
MNVYTILPDELVCYTRCAVLFFSGHQLAEIFIQRILLEISVPLGYLQLIVDLLISDDKCF